MACAHGRPEQAGQVPATRRQQREAKRGRRGEDRVRLGTGDLCIDSTVRKGLPFVDAAYARSRVVQKDIVLIVVPATCAAPRETRSG